MTTMIERVAVAIEAAITKQKLDNHLTGRRGTFEQIARAAIEAMREPTDYMIRVGNGMEHEEAPGTYYEGMIQAALDEPDALKEGT